MSTQPVNLRDGDIVDIVTTYGRKYRFVARFQDGAWYATDSMSPDDVDAAHLDFLDHEGKPCELIKSWRRVGCPKPEGTNR